MLQYDPEVDYYEILQVHPRAHAEVIKRAYRTILGLLQAHPDLGGNHETAVRVNAAYAVLSDPEQRQVYDTERRQRLAFHAPPPSDAHHITHSASGTRAVIRTAPRMRTLVCPRCGRRNRLPVEVEADKAHCGHCQALLVQQHAVTETAEYPLLRPSLRRRLANYGEVRVRLADTPSSGLLHCRRCGHAWPAPAQLPLPSACPRCHGHYWRDVRVFQCRFCGHRFNASRSFGIFRPWAYWLCPACPSCARRRGHRGCERHPLRGVLNAVGMVFFRQ